MSEIPENQAVLQAFQTTYANFVQVQKALSETNAALNLAVQRLDQFERKLTKWENGEGIFTRQAVYAQRLAVVEEKLKTYGKGLWGIAMVVLGTILTAILGLILKKGGAAPWS